MCIDLTWSDDRTNELIGVLSREDELESGYASIFVPLTETVAVKLFPCENWRNMAREKQSDVFPHGYAPQAGDAFELPEVSEVPLWDGDGESLMKYGYVTEIAAPANNGNTSEEQRSQLIETLQGIRDLEAPTDMETTPANFGFVRGRLVYVDFDIGSWS